MAPSEAPAGRSERRRSAAGAARKLQPDVVELELRSSDASGGSSARAPANSRPRVRQAKLDHALSRQRDDAVDRRRKGREHVRRATRRAPGRRSRPQQQPPSPPAGSSSRSSTARGSRAGARPSRHAQVAAQPRAAKAAARSTPESCTSPARRSFRVAHRPRGPACSSRQIPRPRPRAQALALLLRSPSSTTAYPASGNAAANRLRSGSVPPASTACSTTRCRQAPGAHGCAGRAVAVGEQVGQSRERGQTAHLDGAAPPANEHRLGRAGAACRAAPARRAGRPTHPA